MRRDEPYGPSPPEGVHDRGSQGCRVSVEPDGVDRLELPARAVADTEFGAVVVVPALGAVVVE
jgi:hypothetical protein